MHPSLQWFLALVILRMVMSLRLMYSPILLRNIAQVLLLNHIPSQRLESGDTTNWEETFPWSEFDENLQGAFCKLCKKGGRSLQRTGGAWITKPFTSWKKETQKMKSHSKNEVHLLSCQLGRKLIKLEKKDPLSASLKMLASSKDYKIGRWSSDPMYTLSSSSAHCTYY